MGHAHIEQSCLIEYASVGGVKTELSYRTGKAPTSRFLLSVACSLKCLSTQEITSVLRTSLVLKKTELGGTPWIPVQQDLLESVWSKTQRSRTPTLSRASALRGAWRDQFVRWTHTPGDKDRSHGREMQELGNATACDAGMASCADKKRESRGV
jgi:hypothetical protein